MALANKFEQTSVTTTREFTLKFLEQITNNFSEEHEIGRGGFGVVYKGVLENGEEIALKKLHRTIGLDDTQFRNEFNNLMQAQHPNITRLVGYCYHVGYQRIKFNSEYIFAFMKERVLCFEYLKGGSLDKHISDESCGLDWSTRFKVIEGVCLGLNYLHNGSRVPIYHLDLKPQNILLDTNMVPKIGDFGLSRLFPSTKTYNTTKIMGTIGYMPPEYIQRCEITSKYDVFSLGVIIIRIMAGDEGYSKFIDMSPQEFLEQVHENWGKRLRATMSSHTSEQVNTCIQIALRCVDVYREKRPTIAEIVDELNKVSDVRSKPALNQSKVSGRRRRTPPFPFHAWSNQDEVHLTIGVSSPVEPQTRQRRPLRRRWLSWWRHLVGLAIIVGLLVAIRVLGVVRVLTYIVTYIVLTEIVSRILGVILGVLLFILQVLLCKVLGFILNRPVELCP